MPKCGRDDALMIVWSIWMKDTHGNVFWTEAFSFWMPPKHGENIRFPFGCHRFFFGDETHPNSIGFVRNRRIKTNINILQEKDTKTDHKTAILEKKGSETRWGHSKAILGIGLPSYGRTVAIEGNMQTEERKSNMKASFFVYVLVG